MRLRRRGGPWCLLLCFAIPGITVVTDLNLSFTMNDEKIGLMDHININGKINRFAKFIASWSTMRLVIKSFHLEDLEEKRKDN